MATLATAPGEPGGRLETPRAAGIAGLAFAALFVASLVLLRDHPSSGSTAAEIKSYYLDKEAASVALVGPAACFSSRCSSLRQEWAARS
jgi:hypothetical protein